MDNKKLQSITFRCTDEMKQILLQKAKKERRSLSQIIEILLEKQLKEENHAADS